MKEQVKQSSVQVTAKTRAKLMILKQRLDCKTIGEVIEKLLKITTNVQLAKELEK